MTAPNAKPSLAAMKERRNEGDRRRNQAREARWREQRLAVPYRTDGPRISRSVLWFVVALGLGYTQPILFAVVAAAIAGIAGLQTGHTWAPTADRRITSGLAGFIGLSGIAGGLGVGLALVVGALGLTAYVAGTLPHVRPAPATGSRQPSAPSHGDRVIHTAETFIRSSVPAGLASASLIAILGLESGAFIALVLLVSAYEAGDFLIGTGSANAIEGPLAGIFALVIVSAAVYLVLPAPFSTDNFPLFVVLVAVAAPLGQVAASGLLPRGDSWAPALRRLDSYLIAAPLWLLLLPRP